MRAPAALARCAARARAARWPSSSGSAKRSRCPRTDALAGVAATALRPLSSVRTPLVPPLATLGRAGLFAFDRRAGGIPMDRARLAACLGGDAAAVAAVVDDLLPGVISEIVVAFLDGDATPETAFERACTEGY